MGLLVRCYSEVSWLHRQSSMLLPIIMLKKSALTKEEQSKIQAGIPTDNEVTYALIYQQETLPATGSSTSVLTALGLLAVGSLVLLVHKKKKVSSLFLVTTIGLISLF